MNYLDLNDIDTIQLDHTSRCNLMCPQCARVHDGNGLNPNMNIADLTLEDYEILLSPFKADTVKLFHCGNFGDVIASPTFMETFEYSMAKKVKRVKIETNGSMRTPEWWTELAKMGKDRVVVNFAIDGLKDTNHLYRVGSIYDKVIENAKAFISAGGYASWSFIEFKHNYHQIDEARDIAKNLGFFDFSVKYTSRFADVEVNSVTNRKKEIVEEKKNHNTTHKERIIEKYDSFEKYVNETSITCKYKNMNWIFVDMNMNMWPCCWMGAPKYLSSHTEQRKSFGPFFDKFGTEFNNMRKHGWNVLNHDFYQTYLYDSWVTPNNETPRIYTCGRTCGEKFEFSSGYGKNINREKL